MPIRHLTEDIIYLCTKIFIFMRCKTLSEVKNRHIKTILVKLLLIFPEFFFLFFFPIFIINIRRHGGYVKIYKTSNGYSVCNERKVALKLLLATQSALMPFSSLFLVYDLQPHGVLVRSHQPSRDYWTSYLGRPGG